MELDYAGLDVRTIYMRDQVEVERVRMFLAKHELHLDPGLEELVGIYSASQLIACGGISGNTLRCIAVDSPYQGTGVLNQLLSTLVTLQYEKGHTHLFIYTRPESYKSFTYLGFQKIAEVDSQVVLMENRPDGILEYVTEIGKQKSAGPQVSGLVMNCNPFTLGHQYLIEKASESSDYVHVFVVSEDYSIFPAEVRYHLVQDGVRHLSNVTVHKGGKYIISRATFPSYFIHDAEDVVRTHALLDLTIFSKYIAPALGIRRRFVGEEPYCPVTGIYNAVMKNFLPEQGITVTEIPRKSVNQQVVSASTVRKLIAEGDLRGVQELVPETTYQFLQSPGASGIIAKLKNWSERH